MSCGPASGHTRPPPKGLLRVLGDEGFRLFFPLSAIYLAVFPVLWIVVWGHDLPLATRVPPSLWHAHEMLVGGFGAALIGFLTTAAADWTDTEPPRGRPLWLLAMLWGLGRVVGVLGWDGLGAIGVIADIAWLCALCGWLLHLSWRRRTDRLLAFAFWIALLTGSVAITRLRFMAGETGGTGEMGDIDLAIRGLSLVGFAFLGLLGLALARITVPVTNLILDPTERTAPYRPHPGRLHLAPGLMAVAMVGTATGQSPQVSAYLIIAAGCAFMDRVAEAFIGRAALRAEILLLSGASAGAGIGLILLGAAMLGAPWTEVAGYHVALMGGLGIGVYAVFSIAGLLHTDQPLGLGRSAKLGGVALLLSVGVRVAPEFGLDLGIPTLAVASILWALGLMLWLTAYWRALRYVPSILNESPDPRSG